MVIIVGKISVPVAGTPVRLTDHATFQAALVAAGISSQFKTAQAILFQAWKGNTDEVYIGTQTLNRTTGAGVAAVLGVPAAGNNPSFGAANQMSPAGIDVSAFWLDADVNGEGAVVTILVS